MIDLFKLIYLLCTRLVLVKIAACRLAAKMLERHGSF